MAKGKKSAAESSSPSVVAMTIGWISSALGRRLAAAAIVVAALIGLSVSGWQKWGPTITQTPNYVLDESKFEVTPQPTYIHANIKRDAVRSGNLAGLSILDPKLTEKVQHAFAVQTWVASVEQIHKHHPARVVVSLRYRRPIGMVEIEQGEERGLLPIDTEGVLLPPEDFSANQVRNFLRVSVGPTTPQGPVGTPWGDARVMGAAKIAEVLEEGWQKLQLYRIQYAGDDATGAPLFDISTREGAKIIWGHAPGQEASGESTASEKVAFLASWYEQNGPLGAGGSKRELNVRDSQRAGTPAAAVKLKKL